MRRAFLDSAWAHAVAFCTIFFGAPVALIVACYVYFYHIYSLAVQQKTGVVGTTPRRRTFTRSKGFIAFYFDSSAHLPNFPNWRYSSIQIVTGFYFLFADVSNMTFLVFLFYLGALVSGFIGIIYGWRMRMRLLKKFGIKGKSFNITPQNSFKLPEALEKEQHLIKLIKIINGLGHRI